MNVKLELLLCRNIFRMIIGSKITDFIFVDSVYRIIREQLMYEISLFLDICFYVPQGLYFLVE